MKKNPPAISFDTATNTANITLPQRWEHLTQTQAHKLLRLLSSPIPRTKQEIKLHALQILTKFQVIGQSPDKHWIIQIPNQQCQYVSRARGGLPKQCQGGNVSRTPTRRRNSRRVQKAIIGLTTEEIANILRELDWILQPSQSPWRPDRISGRRAKHTILQDLPFGQWLAIENLWAGYLQTSVQPNSANTSAGPRPEAAGGKEPAEGILRQMLHILTNRPTLSDIPHRAKAEAAGGKEAATAITIWLTALKQHLTRLYPDFYTPINDSASLAPEGQSHPTAQQLRAVMNAQIRALTKGDITKEEQILSLPMHRALTELNALAKESREIKEKTKK